MQTVLKVTFGFQKDKLKKYNSIINTRTTTDYNNKQDFPFLLAKHSHAKRTQEASATTKSDLLDKVTNKADAQLGPFQHVHTHTNAHIYHTLQAHIQKRAFGFFFLFFFANLHRQCVSTCPIPAASLVCVWICVCVRSFFSSFFNTWAHIGVWFTVNT